MECIYRVFRMGFVYASVPLRLLSKTAQGKNHTLMKGEFAVVNGPEVVAVIDPLFRRLRRNILMMTIHYTESNTRTYTSDFLSEPEPRGRFIMSLHGLQFSWRCETMALRWLTISKNF